MNTTNVPKRLQHTASGKPEAAIPSADELVARQTPPPTPSEEEQPDRWDGRDYNDQEQFR